jgi:hypothetical protein
VSDGALLEAAARSRAAEGARGAGGAGGAGARRGAEPPRAPRDARDERGGRGERSDRDARGLPARPGAARGRAHFSPEAELVELILCSATVAERVAAEGVVDELQDPDLKRLAALILERRSGPSPFEASELLAELPRGMAERVSRRLTSSSEVELQRAASEWFARRAERGARADRKVLIARLRAAEHRRDEAQIAAALAELSRLRQPAAPIAQAGGEIDATQDSPPAAVLAEQGDAYDPADFDAEGDPELDASDDF